MTKKKPRYESRVEVIAGSRLPLCPRMSNLEGTPLLTESGRRLKVTRKLVCGQEPISQMPVGKARGGSKPCCIV